MILSVYFPFPIKSNFNFLKFKLLYGTGNSKSATKRVLARPTRGYKFQGIVTQYMAKSTTRQIAFMTKVEDIFIFSRSPKIFILHYRIILYNH